MTGGYATRGAKKVACNQPGKLPAILLGRITAGARHAGRGLGAALLEHFTFKAMEVSGTVGA
jgi:hypothetical protein